MNYNGSAPKVYEYRLNDELKATGTMEEICKELGTNRNALWNKVCRYRKGYTKRNKHELIETQNSIHTYVMLIEDQFIGVGTITELSKISNYCVEYLSKLTNGYYTKRGLTKTNKIKMFKRVE